MCRRKIQPISYTNSITYQYFPIIRGPRLRRDWGCNCEIMNKPNFDLSKHLSHKVWDCSLLLTTSPTWSPRLEAKWGSISMVSIFPPMVVDAEKRAKDEDEIIPVQPTYAWTGGLLSSFSSLLTRNRWTTSLCGRWEVKKSLRETFGKVLGSYNLMLNEWAINWDRKIY